MITQTPSEAKADQLQEHWDYLIQDEKLFPTIQDQIRNNTEISKMRKYLIEFILNIGDKLNQRTLTMQIAVK